MADPISGTIAAVASYVGSAFAASAVGTATLAQAATVFAVNAAATIAVNVAATALLQPKVGSSGPTMEFKSDTTAPIRGVMGRMAIGGNRIFKRTWGRTNVYLTSVALLSLGPCQAVEQFKAGEQFVSFGQSQGGASGKYAGHMWMTYRYGLPGTSALTPPQGVFIENPKLTAWTSQHRADGHVTAMWTLAQAEDVQKRDLYTQGEPDALWIGRWMKVWDPRQDSTYPGGSGSQRRDQWNTWGYTDNPYLHAIAWIRGHAKLNADGTVDRTKRIAGVGAPERAIDIAAYVEGANIADANGWKIAGEWSTSDDKWQVLAAMLQAGGGVPLNRGAQISCMVNTPRASIYTYTRNDLVGGATVKALKARRDRKNTVVPRYRSEAHGWEIVPAGAVTSSVYRAEDRGEPRTIEIEYSYVTSAKQAGELGAYDVANMREGLETSLPSKPHLLGLRAGDAFTTDLPELGLVAQKFIVQRRAFDPQTGVVTLDVLSEADAKHAWALGQTASPPPTPSLVGVDPDYVAPPELPEWTVVVRPPAGDGSQQPGFEVIGGSAAADASSVVMEHGQSPTGPWKQFYDGALKTTGRVPIDGLQPGETYYVAVRYRRDSSGALSERTIYGPYTAPSLTAGDTAAVAGYPASDLLKDVQSVETLAGRTRDAVTDLEQVYGDT
ncbi:phage tail protein, partial [uncultured Brevundimonas sp.]|uniref:phage tail protein n=1 Tax=uncultured Brevundimonas sp. TaxID=213418 RepID=UPI0025CCA535